MGWTGLGLICACLRQALALHPDNYDPEYPDLNLNLLKNSNGS